MGSDLVYSILSPEWNADRPRRQGSLLDCSRTPVPGIDLQVGVYGGGWIGGSGHEDSSHNILTLDDLAGLSRSQVTPGLSCPCGYGRYVEVYIHT
jgi:hypothetical protein